MPDNPTPEQVRASIVPKSDQLNADDLLTGPITVTITGVKRGDKEQPVVVEIEGRRPYKPCKSMRRILVATYTEDPTKWIGQRMTLYCDPAVLWGGVKVGGIRISHLSGLANPRTYMQTVSRGKRFEVTIHPIAGLTKEEQEYVATAKEELQQSASIEQLQGYGQVLAKKSTPIQDALRPVYAAKLKDLQGKHTELGARTHATKTTEAKEAS